MKKLHTGKFLWPLYDKIGELPCPPIPSNITTEAIIVGGGISGLLTAFCFWRQGIPFVLVEANKIGSGSTLASTGLVQYSSDITLPNLRARIGKEKADCFYKASAEAVYQLGDIAQLLKEEIGDPHFYMRSSIQFAANEEDISILTQQLNACQSIGLPCDYLGTERFSLTEPMSSLPALQTFGDAEFNPFIFVRYLALFLLKQGALLYEHATFTQSAVDQAAEYRINTHVTVNAKHIVYTVGYQPEQLKEDYIRPILNRSYVIVTKPINELDKHYEGQLIWETSHPYFYVRSTIDQRVIIGGLDERIATPNENTMLTSHKNNRLLAKLSALFPALSVDVDYYWNATFAESEDLLPFIGPSPEHPSFYYLCGYGGNGTVYSMLGARLLAGYINQSLSNEDRLLSTIVQLKR